MTRHRPTAGTSSRLAWIDVAKTIAITLIVVYHVSGVAANELAGGRGFVGDIWWGVSQTLIPVRIPLFFLLAGYLATRAIERPLAAVGGRKVGDPLWVFLVWSLAFALVVGQWQRPDDPTAGIAASAASIGLGGTAYWFLFALPLYFLVTRLLRNVRWLALVISAALYIASPTLAMLAASAANPEIGTSARRLTGFWCFYVIGAFAARHVSRIAQLPWWVATVAVGVFVAITALGRAGITLIPILTPFVMSGLGVAALLIISRLIAETRIASAAFTTVAQATLPIYVVHSLVLHAAYLVSARTGVELPPSTPVDVLFVPILTAGLIALAIGAKAGVQRLSIRGVFDLPRPRAPRRMEPSG